MLSRRKQKIKGIVNLIFFTFNIFINNFLEWNSILCLKKQNLIFSPIKLKISGHEERKFCKIIIKITNWKIVTDIRKTLYVFFILILKLNFFIKSSFIFIIESWYL